MPVWDVAGRLRIQADGRALLSSGVGGDAMETRATVEPGRTAARTRRANQWRERSRPDCGDASVRTYALSVRSQVSRHSLSIRPSLPPPLALFLLSVKRGDNAFPRTSCLQSHRPELVDSGQRHPPGASVLFSVLGHARDLEAIINGFQLPGENECFCPGNPPLLPPCVNTLLASNGLRSILFLF